MTMGGGVTSPGAAWFAFVATVVVLASTVGNAGVAAEGLSRRFGHSLTSVPSLGLVAFGGYSFQGPPIREAPEGVLFSEDTHGLHNDLWLLNSTWQWQTMAVTQGSSLPPPRAHHAATYDAASNCLIVSGGMGTYHYGVTNAVPFEANWELPTSTLASCGMNDVWRFCFASKTWEQMVENSGESCDVEELAKGGAGAVLPSSALIAGASAAVVGALLLWGEAAR